MTATRNLLIGPIILGLTVALAGCSQQAQPAAAPATAEVTATSPVPNPADELMGVWRMSALENNASGAFQSIPYTGQIAFDSRTVSVQAANPDTTAPDTAYTINGYEAFYGDLRIDPAAGTWSVDVTSALARDLVGQTLTRNYDVTDDTLVLTPVDASEGWRVTYERVSD